MSAVPIIEHARPPAAFPLWLQEPVFGLRAENTGAGDWFVLAHLGFFFLLLTCFGWAAWSIWRRTCRPEPHVRLLMEMEEAAAEARLAPREPRPGGETGVPWERSADWWKAD